MRGKGLPPYEFTLRLEQELDETHVEELYGRCADASVETGSGETEITFSREAPGWAEAIGSAIRDVESIPGLRVTGAGQEDLVSILEIARRTGRSREAVRLWAAGKRGPGDFPAPTWRSPAEERFWAWTDVARWVVENLNLAVEVSPVEIRWADEILKARSAVVEAHRILEEADEATRRQLGPLLDAV